MNFRYRLIQFMSGRYGVDGLFYGIFGALMLLSVINIFLRSGILQLVIYALMIYAIFRMFSRNFEARRAENQKFAQFSEKIKRQREMSKKRKADYLHIYKKCPRCKAVLRLPRRKGKHTTVCPKCSYEFKVRVYK